MMRRREFIALLGGAAAPWSSNALTQQAPVPVIGFLSSRTSKQAEYIVSAFRQGLKEVGYNEGQNVAIQFRFANSQNDRLPSLAADLVRENVAVIVAGGTSGPAKE